MMAKLDAPVNAEAERDRAPSQVTDVLRESGSPIPDDVRREMEPRFGFDLGKVRVHEGARAAEAAESVQAKAFTVGSHVVFRDGVPGVGGGRALWAHELAHVVQQRSSSVSTTLRESAAHESHADQVADVVARGGYAAALLKAAPRGAAPALMRKRALSKPSESDSLERDELLVDFETLGRRKAGGVGDETRTPKGGSLPGDGDGVDLIIIVDDDQARRGRSSFTAEITAYISSNLHGDDVTHVVDIDGVFAVLRKYRGQRQRVRRLRLVTHGWAEVEKTGDVAGDVAISNDRERRQRRMSPREVVRYAQKGDRLRVVHDVLSPNAVVEFWGCAIGSVEQANQAWSYLFQSDFVSTAGKFHALTYTYSFGKGPHVRSSSEVDRYLKSARNRGGFLEGKAHFHNFLRAAYAQMVANGDVAPEKTDDDIVQSMMARFDQAGGILRHLGVFAKDGSGKATKPSSPNWKDLWVTYGPLHRNVLAAPGSSIPEAAPAKRGPARPATPPPRLLPSPTKPAPAPFGAQHSPAPEHPEIGRRSRPGTVPSLDPPSRTDGTRVSAVASSSAEASRHARQPERNVGSTTFESLLGDEWYRVGGFDIADASLNKPGVGSALDAIVASARGAGGTASPVVTVYGSESVSRRAGPQGLYGLGRAHGVAVALRERGIRAFVASGRAPLPAPLDLGRHGAGSSPGEKSDQRGVLVHIEHASGSSVPEVHVPVEAPSPHPIVVARTVQFEIPFSTVTPTPVGPVLVGGDIKLQVAIKVVGGAYLDINQKLDLIKKKVEFEAKKKIGAGALKVKAGVNGDPRKWLSWRAWRDNLKLGYEIEYAGNVYELGLEASLTPAYVQAKRCPLPLIEFDIAGAHYSADIALQATFKVGPNWAFLVTEAGTATALEVGATGGGVALAEIAWAGFGLASAGAAMKKGRIEAAARFFVRGYADMLGTLAGGGIEQRGRGTSHITRAGTQAAMRAYVDDGVVFARDDLMRAGRDAALYQVGMLGRDKWEALKERLTRTGDGDTIRRTYREILFAAICGDLGSISASDALGIDDKDLWAEAESALQRL